ncbi:MAG TPA: hypothetical protein G4N98_08590 [Thermoflexia bacterium]|nr:hypothetical protein [Thermoflexia bacterium]
MTWAVIVAIAISLIWRQIGGGGTEIARLWRTEGLLGAFLLIVSPQAIAERLQCSHAHGAVRSPPRL